MRVLVVNPNTSPSVSALLDRHARAAAPAGVDVHTVTARFGASYIASEASYAIAAHAALDAWAVDEAKPPAGFGPADAILVGCFGDPGVFALREVSGQPVLGLAEAAMRLAAEQGRFVIVTGGAAWVPMLERLARALHLGEMLAAVHAVAPSGAELAADPAAAIRLLSRACDDAAASSGAASVILGGAGLAGMAERLQPALAVPVIDSVQAGVQMLVRVAREVPAWAAAPLLPASTAAAPPQWSGLGPALQHRLR